MKPQPLLLAAVLTAVVMGSIVLSAIAAGGFGAARTVADAQPVTTNSQTLDGAASVTSSSPESASVPSQSVDTPSDSTNSVDPGIVVSTNNGTAAGSNTSQFDDGEFEQEQVAARPFGSFERESRERD